MAGAWRADGTPFWHTAFGQSASSSPEHGITRMWASPVVGDFDRDGVIEIAVGSDADGSSGGNIAVYDGHGELKPGWPRTFGTTEVRSIAAADVDGDGQLELLVSLKDTVGGGLGGVQIWDLPGSAANCVLWGTGRGGLLRQGYVPK